MVFIFICAGGLPACRDRVGSGKWTVRAPLPLPRTEVAAVQFSGKIFIIGGLGKSGDLLEEYNPHKDSWHRRTSLPRSQAEEKSTSLADTFQDGKPWLPSIGMILLQTKERAGRLCLRHGAHWLVVSSTEKSMPWRVSAETKTTAALTRCTTL
jgi:hypothetical protein